MQPVQIGITGRRGWPRKTVNQNWLAYAMSACRKISLQALADAIGIHRNTLHNYMRLYGVYTRFSEISDCDLDLLIQHFKNHKPTSGLRYAMAFLRWHGLHVQKRRIRMSMRRIDGLGQTLRNHEAIDRRTYEVPHSNYLWHTDGHHKLIRWGIVIHSSVDGFCHTVSFLFRCSSGERNTN